MVPLSSLKSCWVSLTTPSNVFPLLFMWKTNKWNALMWSGWKPNLFFSQIKIWRVWRAFAFSRTESEVCGTTSSQSHSFKCFLICICKITQSDWMEHTFQSIGFWSGLRLGHSNYINTFSSIIDLAACVSSLLCWKVNIHDRIESFAVSFQIWSVFSSIIIPSIRIMPPPSRYCIFSFHNATCSLIFSNEPLRPSQHSCMYPNIKFYTGGLIRGHLKKIGNAWFYLEILK